MFRWIIFLAETQQPTKVMLSDLCITEKAIYALDKKGEVTQKNKKKGVKG
jgi:hypothetical protein